MIEILSDALLLVARDKRIRREMEQFKSTERPFRLKVVGLVLDCFQPGRVWSLGRDAYRAGYEHQPFSQPLAFRSLSPEKQRAVFERYAHGKVSNDLLHAADESLALLFKGVLSGELKFKK